MTNEASAPFENFMNAKYRLKSAFGISMIDEDFIEIAYRAYRKIGNIATATHCIRPLVTDHCKIPLPCNIEFIESVSSGKYLMPDVDDFNIIYEDNYVPSVSSYYYPDILTSQLFNKSSLTKSELHFDGQLIPYTIIGKNEFIQVSEHWQGQYINISYKGQLLDEDGLPALTPKEVDGIAHWVAYEDTQKRFFMKEPGVEALLAYIKPLAEVKLQAASIPEYLSQNFWDQLLSASTRHDRKQYGISFKLMR